MHPVRIPSAVVRRLTSNGSPRPLSLAKGVILTRRALLRSLQAPITIPLAPPHPIPYHTGGLESQHGCHKENPQHSLLPHADSPSAADLRGVRKGEAKM
jgi:hypothetical protein